MRYKLTAAIIFLLTSGCLVITTLMTRQSGVSSAASAEGQLYLGWGSIAIHLGLPVFGIAAGMFLSNKHRMAALGCWVMVVLCALFSINNVMNFVAAERLSITKSRDTENKIKLARENAALKAADDRQKAITKMVQDQVGWVRGTTRNADNRRERKDSIDASSKVIQDFAKAEIPTVIAPVEKDTAVQMGEGVALISEFTGWNISLLQLANIVQIVLMLLLFEVVGWPTASYLWLLGSPVPAPAGLPPPLPEQNSPEKLALPPPLEPPPIKLRADPAPDWAEMLAKINLPTRRDRAGELRLKDRREVLAWRFYTWLLANGEASEHPSDKIDALYSEWAAADHRNPWGMRIVKYELRELGKRCVETKLPRTGIDGSERLTMWTIHPQTPAKLLALLEKNKVVEAAPQAPAAPEPAPEKKGVVALFPSFGARGTLPN